MTRPIAAIRADIYELVGGHYPILGLLTELEEAITADPGGLREALEFVRDWAHDSKDGDNLYGFDAIEKLAIRALSAETTAPTPLDVERLARALTAVQGGAHALWLARSPRIAREYAALASETTAPNCPGCGKVSTITLCANCREKGEPNERIR